MTPHRLERSQVVSRPLGEVFHFFSRAENLECITPPWLHFHLSGPSPGEMRAGTQIEYRLRLHRIPMIWVSLIEVWDNNRRFVDRQVRGPYRLWRHEHTFTPVSGGTRVQDAVEFALPGGQLGDLAGIKFVRRDLEQIFDYRKRAVAELLA